MIGNLYFNTHTRTHTLSHARTHAHSYVTITCTYAYMGGKAQSCINIFRDTARDTHMHMYTRIHA